MKRLLKWLIGIIVTPFAILALIAFLIYLPPIQDFAVRKASGYASEQTGLNITIGRLRITPIIDLQLDDLVITDAEKDTLLAAGMATVDLDLTDIATGVLGVDAVNFADVAFNSKDFIATMVLRGYAGQFALRADNIALEPQTVHINSATLDRAQLDIAMCDTVVEEDTTSAPLFWKILVDEARVTNGDIRFAMPGDSMVVTAAVALLGLDSANIDLGNQIYDIRRAEAEARTISYFAAGLDTIALDSVNLTTQGVVFTGDPMTIRLEKAALNTPTSFVNAEVAADFSALEVDGEGKITVKFISDISKTDILRAGNKILPKDFARAYPDQPIQIRLTAEGNVDKMQLTEAAAALPGSIYLDATGEVRNLLQPADTSILKQDMQTDLRFNLQTRNLGWVRPLAGKALDGILLPQMHLAGTLQSDGPKYDINTTLRESSSLSALKAKVDTRGNMAYDARMNIQRLNIAHFMPSLGVGLLTAKASARGAGTDPFSPSMRTDVELSLDQLDYDTLTVSGIDLTATMNRGKAHADLISDNPYLQATSTIDAIISRKNADLTLNLDLGMADFCAMGFAEEPLSAGMCLQLDGVTNLKDFHNLNGVINDLIVETADTIYRPETIDLDVTLEPDSVAAFVTSGDFLLNMNSPIRYDKILEQFEHFYAEFQKEFKERRIDQDELRKRIPMLDLHVRAGRENPVQYLLNSMGYAFEDLIFDIVFDPATGANGGGHIWRVNTGAVLIDTITTTVYQDSTGLKFDAFVRNNRRNPQITFDAKLNAYLMPYGAGAHITYHDRKGLTGLDLGIVAMIEEDGFMFHFEPYNPIIAYRTFELNPNNYILMGRNLHVDADVDLVADDGTGLKLYSTDNDEALQDLTIQIKDLNLGELTRTIPYMPAIEGKLDGDAHWMQTENTMSLSTDMTVSDLKYEGTPLGQVGLEAVYLPNYDGTQYVDGSLLFTGMTVATFNGIYRPNTSVDQLDVTATLDRFPLSLANGFIPDQMARLEGSLIGDMHVSGTTAKPIVNGAISTFDTKLLSDVYSLNFRIPDDTVFVKNSHLNLDRVQLLSTGQSPFEIDGTADFADMDNIEIDISMQAKNYELINAKKTAKSLAYGKVFVDFDANIDGTLDDLVLMGNLKVLGNTDVTYILTDSPLTVEDQLSDLVTFEDFSDSIEIVSEETKMQNINALLNVEIDNAAQVHCLLSADKSSYVDLEGGGDLVVTYTPIRDIQVNGRYTINQGKIKYEMMVIPLKEFIVTPGSYVEFRGDMMNPELNLSAKERLRASYSEGGASRNVSFDVGLAITQTLENLGLEFTLDAPEDMTVQNELAAMSSDQRGRVAVTMLATGMYITDVSSLTAGGGSFNTANALSTFLQGQIASLAGKALESVDVDLTLGVESNSTSSGANQTDYSFRFAKRFWGNRISVVVGGKVSTGNEAVNTGQTLIDNVSVEYRLDKSSTRYVTLFYDKNYENILDGEVIEMGGSLVLRRKTNKLGELFLFRNPDRKKEKK
ncbi:MAG: translocation/assembly module TamB domain-containing protein [Bacteroidaceae bacterium]|nr:translocation/assembly module TamB domain-containing protein [Bacteroidaceae bacterium]